MQNYTADQDLANIKILAVDMDFTLLADDGSQPEDMPELIDALADAGVLFCPASGRPGERLKSMFPEHLDEIALCPDNGGCIIYKNELIYKSLIDPAAYQRVLGDAASREGISPVLCAMDGGYLLERDRVYESDHRKYYPHIVYVESYDNVTADADKFSLYFPNYDAEPAFRDYWDEAYNKDFYVTNAGREWIDFMNPGVDKGSGIKHLADYLGISMDDVAACGDTYNDIPMLEAAGHSFVMGNAEEHMHDHAKYLLPSNNDRGVAVLARAILEAKRNA